MNKDNVKVAIEAVQSFGIDHVVGEDMGSLTQKSYAHFLLLLIIELVPWFCIKENVK